MVAPTTLPGRAYVNAHTAKISRLLFHYRARGLNLNAVTGQAPSFSRASAGGAVFDRNGVLRTPAHSQPRFEMVDLDGDGVRETPGLLLEPSRTNSITYARDLTNAAWSKVNATVAKTATGFDGVANAASLLTEDTTNGIHASYSGSFAVTSNTNGAYGVFIRANGRTKGNFYVGTAGSSTGTNRAGVSFDLAAGTVAPLTVGAGTVGASGIITVPGGYLVWFVGTQNGSEATACLVLRMCDALGNGSYAGDGASGMIFDFVQAEPGQGCLTSPIASAGSATARALESLQYPFLASPREMTVYLRFIERGAAMACQVASAFTTIFAIGDPNTGTNAAVRVQTDVAGRYDLHVHDGTTSKFAGAGVGAGSPVPGDLVEIRGVLTAAGTAQCYMTRNGSAESGGSVQTGFVIPSAWSQQLLALGSRTGGASGGPVTILDAKVAAGQQSIDFMREAF